MTSRVEDVMTRNVVSLRTHAQFKDILRAMRARDCSAFPVIDDDGKVIGVLSEDDLLVREGYEGGEPVAGFLMRHADKARARGLTAADLMTRPAITISPTASLAEAARTMHAKHVKRLPVVSADGRLIGIVSRGDVLGIYDRPDSEIQHEVVNGLIDSAFLLDSRAFTVMVTGGVVTIRGPVARAPVARSLLDAIRGVDGVVAVLDRLSYPRD